MTVQLGDVMLKVGSSSRVEQIAEAVLEEIARGHWRVGDRAAFHRAVVEASHNVVLIELYQGLAGAVTESLRRSRTAPGLPEAPHDIHRELYEAIEAGDPTRAAAEAARHLDVLIDTLRRS
ncbi:FadR/GntR family transcriptional regulator [Kitasatospora sp. NPDC052896]|uniref:FadR/GntR family transcriptional regulator n=1 Tax=Kitasatospora sp. NPDC052896 TaxID=3364061 RepID=UPI0037C9B563